MSSRPSSCCYLKKAALHQKFREVVSIDLQDTFTGVKALAGLEEFAYKKYKSFKEVAGQFFSFKWGFAYC